MEETACPGSLEMCGSGVIVDDDAAFLSVARALLEREGISVAGVARGCAEAVERARALQPDVVLIDISLGEESGFGVAQMLAGNGHPGKLIFISTHGEADYADLIADSPAVRSWPRPACRRRPCTGSWPGPAAVAGAHQRPPTG